MEVVKYGKVGTGEQCYLCRMADCRKIFQLRHRYKACDHGVKERIVDMAMSGSGVRDTAQVLSVAVGMVKKACNLVKVNWNTLLSEKTTVEQQPVLLLPVALELDEQCGGKSNQLWLWFALNHYTSEVLSYTLRARTDKACKQLQ